MNLHSAKDELARAKEAIAYERKKDERKLERQLDSWMVKAVEVGVIPTYTPGILTEFVPIDDDEDY